MKNIIQGVAIGLIFLGVWKGMQDKFLSAAVLCGTAIGLLALLCAWVKSNEP